MLVSVLASGSKGNSTYVEANNTKILIDVGPNQKYIEDKLRELNSSLSEIKYILITHTHDDHIKGLKTIINSYNPTIIITELMYKDLGFLKKYDNILFLTDDLNLDGIKVDNIKTSHDTSDSRGYILTYENSSLVQITDTGYLNQKYFKLLENKNIYIFESNHNVELLMHGRYPLWLKRRVNSDKGHLSNEYSSTYLSKLVGKDTKKIILAHLSEENNTPEIALETINSKFKEEKIDFKNIIVAGQYDKTDVVEI